MYLKYKKKDTWCDHFKATDFLLICMTSCQIVVTLKQTRNQINLPSLTENY